MLTINKIQERVAEYYGITVDDLTCESRLSELVGPRHVAMYLCRRLVENGISKLKYKKIGKEFNRDHSTVIVAIMGVKNDLEINEKLKEDIDILMGDLQCHQQESNVNKLMSY